MIVATITGGDGASAKLEAGEGTHAVTGDGGFADGLREILRPGRLPLYNPARGGPYMGVDEGDETALLDALTLLSHGGRLVITYEKRDVTPEQPVPYPVPDDRDLGLMAELATREGLDDYAEEG